MTDEQIKQNAESYANEHMVRTDGGGWEETYDDKEQEAAYIAGAHSRDKEIKELKQKLHEEKDFGDFKDTQINSLKDQLRNPWISVNDRLPDNNQVVLAHHEIIIDGGGEHKEDENVTIQRYVGKWITDRMEQQRMGKWLFDIKDRVTHWMPIPELKKGE